MMRKVAAAGCSKNPNWKRMRKVAVVGCSKIRIGKAFNEMLLKNPNWKKYNILGLLDVYVNYFFGSK
jgi:hypothetical protein